MDKEDWQKARDQAETEEDRPASEIVREWREEQTEGSDEIQCAECGCFVDSESDVYSVVWRKWTSENVENHGSCWLCNECIRMLPRAP